jgi:hypothetical protein
MMIRLKTWKLFLAKLDSFFNEILKNSKIDPNKRITGFTTTAGGGSISLP